MTTLRPCSRCHRHVRAGDPCPFCGCAPVPGARATIAALALAGALASGCGGGAAAADTTTVRSNDQGRPTTDERTTDAPTTDERRADEQTTEPGDPGERDDDTRRGPDDGGAVAAYGAPSPPPGPSIAPE